MDQEFNGEKEQGAVHKAENAYWADKTKDVSYVNHLHFKGDKKWESCVVVVRGTMKFQEFSIMIKAGNKIIAYEEFSLLENEIKVLERSIGKAECIDVTGQLKSDGFFTAGGSIYVTCTYDPQGQYKSSTATWETDTDNRSSIDNLFLDDNQLWDKCEIYIEGHKDKSTGCLFTLISNGEIHKNGMVDWMELYDTESVTYTFEIKQKVSLIVAGYISNISFSGAGARITLTGYYQ
ncbi:hypothetical protein Ana3638_13420 [Anaerocolumna sedimenticola]|uniref:Uncharacterized protein n=1 Tax=Anaerocolumna sedimenticola TaxID=2696063 RepID=A0A6P1TN80_9FIRM|nr:hypothetical protein [Anaerocolumna sedimenticola]QHQ61649.1 hypothetical protein Ana3638_13420 [Anaerocolumna sedimenticola]